MKSEETKQRIVDAGLAAFAEKGCRFTVDDLEKSLAMSRKTIYRHFSGKDALLRAMLDTVYGEIHTQQHVIYADPSLSIPNRLRAILTVENRGSALIRPDYLRGLQKHFPAVYDYFLQEYATEWQPVEQLLRQGIEAGCYRACNIPLVTALLQNGMQMLCKDDLLERSGLCYQQALCEMVDLVLSGITVSA